MSRAPCTFRQTDLKRAVRGFEAAGKEVVAADITSDGTIRIKFRSGKAAVVVNDGTDINPWDTVDPQ
jgi:hypothetical protein